MAAKKYKDIQALAAAFRSGELDPKLYTLLMDNDYSSLEYTGPVPEGLSDAAAGAWRDAQTEKAEGLFEGKGYLDAVDACNAAGIPTEWV